MYLSLASISILGVLFVDWLLRTIRLARLRPVVLAAAAIALGVLTYLRNEEYRSREVVWRIAVERMPDSVRARANYAQGLLVNNKNAEVVEILRHALELAPYDSTCLMNMAAAYEALGEFPAAAECYARLRDAYPNDWKNWRSYAAEMLLLGRWSEAEDSFRRAAELNKQAADNGKASESAEPHYGRAAALFALGQTEEADEEARAASAIDSTWPEAVLALARTTVLDERMRDLPRRVPVGAHLGETRAAILERPASDTPRHARTLFRGQRRI